MLLYQIVEFTTHGKKLKSHIKTINLKSDSSLQNLVLFASMKNL